MTTLNNYAVSRPLQATDGGLLTLSSPTTLLGAGLDDDSSASTAIGFTFPLDGLSCTNFTANANGWALLYGSAPASVYANTLFGDAAPGALVAPWWDDLRTAVTIGYVKTELQGASPNRCRVIEWKCYGQYSQNATDNDTLTFQAVLWESGRIDFRYGTVANNGSPTRTAYSATVGVRGDCSGSINGHIRDFFGAAGTPVGSATPTVSTGKAAGTGSTWPADPSHLGIPVGAYNIHFDPVAAPVKPRILSMSYSGGPTTGATAAYATTSTLTLNVGAGPVYVRSSAPANFDDFAADLITQATANVPSGAPWSFRYDANSKRFTIESGTGGTFSYALGGNLAAYLGMGATGDSASTYAGWKAPQGVLECLSIEVDPPQDASRMDLATFRHGRSLATIWGSVMTFRCRAWISSADRAAWQAGYLTTGKVRVYQAGGALTPYSATNIGGYLEGFIVHTGELAVHGQNESVLAWAFTIAQARE